MYVENQVRMSAYVRSSQTYGDQNSSLNLTDKVL